MVSVMDRTAGFGTVRWPLRLGQRSCWVAVSQEVSHGCPMDNRAAEEKGTGATAKQVQKLAEMGLFTDSDRSLS